MFSPGKDVGRMKNEVKQDNRDESTREFVFIMSHLSPPFSLPLSSAGDG